MIDLRHIHFSGEDRPKENRPGDRSQIKTSIRKPREPGLAVLQKGGSPQPASLRALSPLLTFIFRQSGLEVGGYQMKALNRRMAACLRVLRATSEQAAILVLQRKPELLESSLSALLIGVSEFFRDESVFERLRKSVLPQTLHTKRALRVYSAGCSAGHELYSVAMILDELGSLDSSQLLGVDCRPDAIEQARSGSFAISDLKGLDSTRRQRYFCLEGRRALVLPGLRRNTSWHAADLTMFRDGAAWDLILFRNVAIYLETEYASMIWHGLDQQLKPGGVVVTGSAERPPEDLGWKRESACIYRKQIAPIL